MVNGELKAANEEARNLWRVSDMARRAPWSRLVVIRFFFYLQPPCHPMPISSDSDLASSLVSFDTYQSHLFSALVSLLPMDNTESRCFDRGAASSLTRSMDGEERVSAR